MSVPVRDDRTPGAVGQRSAGVRSLPRPRPSELLHNLTVLEHTPALFALPDHTLRRLARRLRPMDLEPETTVVEQGSRGDSLYLVARGTLLVTVETELDGRAQVARVGEGDLCGWSALSGEPSPVSVVSTAGCRVLALDLPSLQAVVPPDSPTYGELREYAAKRESGYRDMAAHVQRDAAAPAGEAMLIAVYSPKGGSGRTTVALNLAAELARGHAGQVMFLDLDFPYFPAALLSGLVPPSSIMKASWAASLGTLADLRETLVSASQLHQSGFLLLPGALQIAESELITTDQVTTALRALRGAFRHIVVDVGSSLAEISLSVCEAARHVVLVVAPELQGLKGARDALRLFQESLHIPEDRITLVLNRRQADAVVSRASVERTLGIAPTVEIGHDGNRPERAAMTGSMLATTDPKSEIARGVRRLAARLGAPGERRERAR